MTQNITKLYIKDGALEVPTPYPKRKDDIMVLWALRLFYHLDPASIHSPIAVRSPAVTSSLMKDS